MKQILLLLGISLCFFGTSFGQTVIYSENFTSQDGKGATGTSFEGGTTTYDTTGVSWTINVGTTLETDGTTNQFEVVSGVFTGKDVDGSAYWFSPEINVTSYTAINISVDLGILGNGANSSGENVTVYYTLNPSAGSPTYSTAESFTDANDSELPKTVSVSNIDVSSTNEFGIRIEIDANGTGDGFTFDNISVVEYSVKAEPSNHPTSFTATTDGYFEIDLSWTDATGAVVPDGYLVKASETSYAAISNPVDGTAEADDSDASDGSGILNISSGNQSASFSGLDDNTQYFFKIYSYTNSDSDIDYKTDGTIATATATTDEAPEIVLNEFLADPDGTTGDANGDGTVNTTADEFVEFVNKGTTDIDISSWTISDGSGVQHTFAASTTLKPSQAVIVFGGGTPTGDFGDALVFTTSGLSLNNGGDSIILKNNSGNTVLTYTYGSEGGNNESITRSPDLTGSFTAHKTADTGDASSYSPGTKLDGTTFQPSVSITGAEGWRMMSTPNSNNTYDDLLGDLWTQGIGTGADATNGTANVQLYNTSTDNFAAATDLTANMTAGVGFLVYVYSDDDYNNSVANAGFPKLLSVFGTENSGTITPTLNDGADAWTLVGNPYASTIDWDLVGKTEVTGTVYVYDHSYGTPSGSDVAASGSAGSYRVWNGSTGSLTDGLITPFQGFWVQNASSVTSPSLSIEEADKSSGGTFYKGVVPSTIALNAEMNGLKNDTYFSFNESGDLGKDNFDGYELVPLDFADYLSLSTGIDGESFDINNLPKDLNESVEIALQVAAFHADTDEIAWVPMSGEVSLSWPMMSAIPDGWSIELKDYDTGTSIDLMMESSYTFILEATETKTKANKAYSALTPISVTIEETNDTGRFAIVITPSTAVTNESEESPAAFTLEQNYPNPFNPSTTISYSVQKAGPVNISVYNLMGQKVATLVNETKSAGQYNVRWNAAGAASGMYYYRLEAGGQTITRKMTLIK